MNYIIPMAGHGERFKKAGYDVPKPLLTAHGKTLLEWSVDSLPLQLCSTLIFVGLAKHASAIEPILQARYKPYNIKTMWLEHVTEGQAETVLVSSPLWDMNTEVVIFNIDTVFSSNSLANTLLNHHSDGVLGSFYSQMNQYSYASLGNNGIVNSVIEKEVISTNALTGLYHFTNPEDYILECTDMINQKDRVKQEYYVSNIYQRLIMKGRSFVLDPVDSIAIVGTPSEYEAFLQSNDYLA